MARIGICNRCGHRQYVGYNAVDGRWKCWTRCEECKQGNFQTPPAPRLIDGMAKAHRAALDEEQRDA